MILRLATVRSSRHYDKDGRENVFLSFQLGILNFGIELTPDDVIRVISLLTGGRRTENLRVTSVSSSAFPPSRVREFGGIITEDFLNIPSMEWPRPKTEEARKAGVSLEAE